MPRGEWWSAGVLVLEVDEDMDAEDHGLPAVISEGLLFDQHAKLR